MNHQVLYDRAAALAAQLRRHDFLIRTANERGDLAIAAEFSVKRMHTEQRLRHLNHHIITSGA